MIGTKIYKPLDDEKQRQYENIATFCNQTQSATIKDQGDYYECVAPPEHSFGELKAIKLKVLENSFDTRVSGSITINPGDYLMQFDTSDSLKMQGAITLMETTGQTEGYLTQADDTTVYHVPLETMKMVLVGMLGAYAQCHARKQELRSQINAAQNVEELSAIEITWPV